MDRYNLASFSVTDGGIAMVDRDMINSRSLTVASWISQMQRMTSAPGMQPEDIWGGENHGSHSKVGVRSGATQNQALGRLLIDQDPVRLHMTVSPALPLASKGVVTLTRVQGIAVAQSLEDDAELIHVLTATLLPFRVSLERACTNYREWPNAWRWRLARGFGSGLVPGHV